jgi:hypothetical protein
VVVLCETKSNLIEELDVEFVDEMDHEEFLDIP